jgi:hypothetical protein
MKAMTTRRFCLTAALLLGALAGCGGKGPQTLGTYTFEDGKGLLDLCPEATLDSGPDGGALRIETQSDRLLVNVCEPEGPRGEAEAIAVGGRIRAELLRDNLYLDLWIFPRDGEPRMTRTALPAIRRTVPWTDIAVRVPLKTGERPVKLRVSLFTDGPGRFWLDDLVVRAGRAADFDGGR